MQPKSREPTNTQVGAAGAVEIYINNLHFLYENMSKKQSVLWTDQKNNYFIITILKYPTRYNFAMNYKIYLLKNNNKGFTFQINICVIIVPKKDQML